MKNCIIGFCLIALSCANDNTVPNRNTMPQGLRFIVLDKQGNNLIKKDTPTGLIYSLKDGQKFYTNYNNGALIKRFFDSSKYSHYYDDLGIALKSVNGVRTFYLELAGKVDTINLEVAKLSSKDAYASGGDYYTKELLVNGKEIASDETVMPPVYVISR